MSRHSLVAGLAVSIALAPFSSIAGQTADVRRGAVEGTQRSTRSATIHWENVPLGDALERLAGTFDRAVFVDRRLDPGQRIRLKIENGKLDDIMPQLAATGDWGASQIGTASYLGPAIAANQLPTLAALRRGEVRALPAADRRSLEVEGDLQWTRLAAPREVVVAAVGERGWRVRGEETIPHDLWSAGQLPKMALADQLTLLLLGFDLTFRIVPAERAIEIVPLEWAAPPKSKLPPNAGPPEMAGRKRPLPASKTKQVYTLRVEEKPAGDVLRQLALRLDWRLEIDEQAIREAGLSLNRRVSFALENGDEDNLLEALLTPAGLDFQRDGQRIRIVPRAGN